ncbi:MAG: endonuclease domain-containing protein [Rhodospirillaceae bacterium]|nr:endonuclease domain-containing protein [Rhodospirillaceae bacterium]
MVAEFHTSPSSEGEVGERSEPGGGAVGHRSRTPPSTPDLIRGHLSPSEEGEESKDRRVKRAAFAKKLAKRLRKQPTDAEKRLWYFLHKKQLDGLRFKRQEPIGKFVANFVCTSLRLVIEVDGGQHGVEVEKDAARTAWLESQGYIVIRFWNNEVMNNIEGVLATIREEVATLKAMRTAPPSTSLRSATSPSEEGEG